MTQDRVSAVKLTEAQQDEIAHGMVARARSRSAKLVGPDGLLSGLRSGVGTALDAELIGHLGYEPHDPAGHHSGNSRNCRRRSNARPVAPVENWATVVVSLCRVVGAG